MAIELRQTFQVRAPVDTVWAFMLNPENVVACMPGASLTQVVDEKSFVGAVKIKVGAVTAQYQGTITYVETDRAAGIVKMLAEGKERGGGTVRGTIVSQLSAIDGGSATSVETRSSIDLTGKIVQVGRGMIEGVSGQIIKMYVAAVRRRRHLQRARLVRECEHVRHHGSAQPAREARRHFTRCCGLIEEHDRRRRRGTVLGKRLDQHIGAEGAQFRVTDDVDGGYPMARRQFECGILVRPGNRPAQGQPCGTAVGTRCRQYFLGAPLDGFSPAADDHAHDCLASPARTGA